MSTDLTRLPLSILGVRFDNVTMTDTLVCLERMVRSRRPHYVVTANVDFLVQARGDVELRRLLFDADLVLCDGTPLVWASRLLGNPLPERVAGADLVPRLIELAAARRFRIFFLGASPESARLAAERVTARHPTVEIAGTYSPPFRRLWEMDHEEIVRQVRAARPDILLVSFGCPKQEKWIGMHYRTLEVPVTIGVGATIDFLAGQVRRAPEWMQRSGTEWLFRLAQEPRRLFRRYAKDLGVFGVVILIQYWWLNTRPSSNERRPASRTSINGTPVLLFPTVLNRQAVASDPCLREVPGGSRPLFLDLRPVQSIDSTGIAFLMELQRAAAAPGRSMVWIGPGPVLLKILRSLRLDDCFTFVPDAEAGSALLNNLGNPERVSCRKLAPGRVGWHGEATALNAEDLWLKSRAHFLKHAGLRCWVLDLTDVPFMDSSGLGVILRLKKLALGSGIDLVLEGIGPAVRNVLRLAQLEKVLLARTAEQEQAAVRPDIQTSALSGPATGLAG